MRATAPGSVDRSRSVYAVRFVVQSGMARLPRLIVAGHPHLLSQRAQHGQAMVRDDADRAALLALLQEAARANGVAVHAYAVLDSRLDLVVTADEANALSRMMQLAARRHAAAFNRRHLRRGSLWEGRFRAAVIEPGDWLLRCMIHVDQLGGRDASRDPRWSSEAAHMGDVADSWLVAPPVFWSLGNTPFERETAYCGRLEHPLASDEARAIEAALRGGWPLGSAAFAARLAERVLRPTTPRPRGRPRVKLP